MFSLFHGGRRGRGDVGLGSGGRPVQIRSNGVHCLARTLSAEWFVGADGYRRGHGGKAGRPDHTVVSEPLAAELRQAWRSPAIAARAADYRAAGANLAADVVATLLVPDMLGRARQAPYPRLRVLLAALDGMEAVAGRRGFRFADPATGKETRLADIR